MVALREFQINGERNPSEVYKDFRSAVLRILGSAEQVNPTVAEADDEILPSVADKKDEIAAKPPKKGYPPVIWVLGKYPRTFLSFFALIRKKFTRVTKVFKKKEVSHL